MLELFNSRTLVRSAYPQVRLLDPLACCGQLPSSAALTALFLIWRTFEDTRLKIENHRHPFVSHTPGFFTSGSVMWFWWHDQSSTKIWLHCMLGHLWLSSYLSRSDTYYHSFWLDLIPTLPSTRSSLFPMKLYHRLYRVQKPVRLVVILLSITRRRPTGTGTSREPERHVTLQSSRFRAYFRVPLSLPLTLLKMQRNYGPGWKRQKGT